MSLLNFFTTLLLLLFSISCAHQKEKSDTTEIKNEIDRYLSNAIDLHNIPGLALAVVQENKVVYQKYLGKSSLEDNKPVDKNTLFRVFSTTKLITATGVFQLIQNNKLSLEDPISNYLDSLPPRWQNIQIKNLLAHSSGLPDLIRYKASLSDKELMEKLSKDPMDFTTGNQFRYNQTNYWLLSKIIERVTGEGFDKYILENQFNSAKTGVLFSSNSQASIPDRATRYFYSDKKQGFERDTNNSGKRGHSGNGLNITLDKFIEWNRQLDDNNLLNRTTKSKMWTPFDYTNQQDNFTHGWDIYHVNGLSSYGFSGGNLAAFRKFVNQKTTIILLSNGYQIPAYDIIINDIARIVIDELRTKKLTKEQDVMQTILDGSYIKAVQSYNTLKVENPNTDFDNLKWNINTLGNSFMYHKQNNEKALELYKLNAEANPNWWISMASLAEVYEAQKDTLSALESYQKAILLNTNNEWSYNEHMKNRIEALKSPLSSPDQNRL